MWPFLSTAVLMEATLAPLGIQPPLHRRRLDFFRKSFLFSTARARERLAFTPCITFSKGAIDTVGWYREHGYL
jgi:nucleoside-diphosphate-sugar epimerase